MRYFGLDVHREFIEICCVDQEGKILRRMRIAADRSALLQFGRKHLRPDDAVALEASTSCWEVVYILREFTERVYASNPLANKYIAQAKVKTDKVDALALAQLLRTGFLPKIWTPDRQTIRNRRLAHRRARLVGDCTRLRNRIHGELAMIMVKAPVKELFSAEGRKWLAGVSLPRETREAIDRALRLLQATERELAEVEQRIAEYAWEDQRVRLLMTIPGVSVTTAFTLMAAIGDVERFKDGAHLASYLGLTPRVHASGKHCYHGRITKAGHSLARWLMVQAAQSVAQHPQGPLGLFFRNLHCRRNKPRNVAVVATARKMVNIAYHLLTNNEPYRYAKPRSTETKLARLRVQATGKRRKPSRTNAGGRRHPNYGTGVRTRYVPGLPEVCAREGLPLPKSVEQLPPGERRFLEVTKLRRVIKQQHQGKRVKR